MVKMRQLAKYMLRVGISKFLALFIIYSFLCSTFAQSGRVVNSSVEIQVGSEIKFKVSCDRWKLITVDTKK